LREATGLALLRVLLATDPDANGPGHRPIDRIERLCI
jgi:hypothetical protein